MEIIIYIIKSFVVLLITWLGVRLIGKKSLAEMSSYDLAAVLVLTTVSAEPLVYKVLSKTTIGVLSIAGGGALIGFLSLKRRFYNFDKEPTIVIANGKINFQELKKNRINIHLLLSELRLMGFYNIQDVEFAIVEPTGRISVIPKSQSRPVTPKDLQINTEYEGIPLPLIVDGEVQKKNLQYAKLDGQWLIDQLDQQNISGPEEVAFAQLDTTGQLYIDRYHDSQELQTPVSY